MTLREELIECFAQAIVVELRGRDIPHQIGTRIGCPLANVHQRERTEHAGRNQHGQNRAVVVLGLRIGRQMLMDDIRHLHTIQQRRNHRERPDIPPFDVCVRLISIPRCRIHACKMAHANAERNPPFGYFAGSGI